MTSQVQHRITGGHKVVVALGSNQASSLGNPEETLENAFLALSERVGAPMRKSRFFQTPAFPIGAGPDFVNAVATFETGSSPSQVLEFCHEIETIAGRTREVRWGQRTLDIDIISFDDKVLPDLDVHQYWRDLPPEEQVSQTPDRLIVPHPRLQDRAFVLVPMMDVAPNWCHPILGLTTREMLAQCPEAEKGSIHPLDMA
jgi:2-amino-4-hydroxy-6-hydroxymethyldihydropteridine diphosphokinase